MDPREYRIYIYIYIYIYVYAYTYIHVYMYSILYTYITNNKHINILYKHFNLEYIIITIHCFYVLQLKYVDTTPLITLIFI